MLFRASVIAGMVVATSLAFSMAMAEDTVTPDANGAVSGVTLTESNDGLSGVARAMGIQFSAQQSRGPSARFVPADPVMDRDRDGTRRFEIAATSSAEATGLPVDVSLRRRTTVNVDAAGNLGPAREGAEVRVGRGLARLVRPWQTSDWAHPTWYLFAASDNEALAWAPGSSGANGGSLRYQGDRVEIGDMQAGVAIEAGGIQAAFAYVQRDIQGRYGSAEENFAGITITRRN